MRTTILLPDRLHSQAKAYAARNRMTLTQLVEEALRARIHPRRETKAAAAPTLPTFRGDGLRPGISLDEMSGVLDAMEEIR